MVRVTSVWIAKILTTVSNAKIHQIRPMLVTALRNWNKPSSHQVNTILQQAEFDLNLAKSSVRDVSDSVENRTGTPVRGSEMDCKSWMS